MIKGHSASGTIASSGSLLSFSAAAAAAAVGLVCTDERSGLWRHLHVKFVPGLTWQPAREADVATLPPRIAAAKARKDDRCDVEFAGLVASAQRRLVVLVAEYAHVAGRPSLRTTSVATSSGRPGSASRGAGAAAVGATRAASVVAGWQDAPCRYSCFSRKGIALAGSPLA